MTAQLPRPRQCPEQRTPQVPASVLLFERSSAGQLPRLCCLTYKFRQRVCCEWPFENVRLTHLRLDSFHVSLAYMYLHYYILFVTDSASRIFLSPLFFFFFNTRSTELHWPSCVRWLRRDRHRVSCFHYHYHLKWIVHHQRTTFRKRPIAIEYGQRRWAINK